MFKNGDFLRGELGEIMLGKKIWQQIFKW